jgi:putative PEP-CTERM system TPR-repeat lipoprotein
MQKLQSRLRLILSLLIALTLSTLTISACGLALDSQAKLERGQKAYDEQEYRAAVIDAKAVLLDEPDNVEARLLLGRASVSIGDGASAEKELRRAMELGVDSGEVIVDLGRSLIQQRKFEEVVAEVTTDAADEENLTNVLRIRAEALLGLDRPAESRELLSRVLERDESDLAAQLGIVNSYIAERNGLQARETLNQILTTNDSYVPALQLSGVLSMQLRDVNRAVVDFRRAAELARADGDTQKEIPALYGLTDAIFLQGQPDEARPIVERMQELAPDDLRTMMVTARLAAADKDWTTAQENLQQILRRSPEFRAAQTLLGAVHKENGNLGQAEMHLSAVVAAMPGNTLARRLLAETRLALNKAEAARQALEPLTSGANADTASLSMAAAASLNLGDVDAAVELLERGVAADPSNAGLNMQLALAYFRNGQFEESRRAVEQLPDMPGQTNEFRRDQLLVLTQMGEGNQAGALEGARSLQEKWPGQADAHSLAGSVEVALGDFEAARSSFNRGLEVAPEGIRLHHYLAALDIKEDDFESAHDRYLLILELQPDDALAMLSLARLSARAEDHNAAREWLEKARSADPNSIAARAMLAMLSLRFGDFDTAEEVAKEAVALKMDSAQLHNLLGLARFFGENYRDAEFSLDRATQLGPDEPIYRFNLARAQIARGNNASALVSLEGSMEQTLQHLPSALLLVSVKADLGDLEGAREIGNRLQELHPDTGAAYALEAELLAQQGDLLGAASAYDQALAFEMSDRWAIRAYQVRSQAGVADPVEPLRNYLETRPLDSNMRLYLAEAYQNLEEVGNANTQYEQVLAQEPENFVATNNLAWNYFTSGDARAEEVARRAYELRPDSGAVVDTLGWILVRKGSLEEGVALLRSAVELENAAPDVRYHLAAALAESGDKEEARSILEELLESGESFENKDAAESLFADLQS